MNYIIGGGMTGLAAGMASKFTVLEQRYIPGGICDSYKLRGYRFETGGGHWIYGCDPIVNQLLSNISQMRTYQRRSGVLFLGGTKDTADLRGLIVPYPIQDNLFALPKELRQAALEEIMREKSGVEWTTMGMWLVTNFGPTLCKIFFDPFHERYTSGLFRELSVQDAYKSPIDKKQVKRGAEQENSDTGYNATFLYPADGLDVVSQWLASKCEVRYNSRVSGIFAEDRTLALASGEVLKYETVICTSPLNEIVEMAGLSNQVGPPDPHTSVFVINIGATLPDTPKARHGYHWLYTPDSRSGFHRVGYYSNVDTLFLPEHHRHDNTRASIYVESAFREGKRPPMNYLDRVISELKQAGLIDEVEAIDPTYVEVAYTWRRPGSYWVERATRACREHGIIPAGRYGRWNFQGVAGSLKEGLGLGVVLRETGNQVSHESLVRGSRTVL